MLAAINRPIVGAPSELAEALFAPVVVRKAVAWTSEPSKSRDRRRVAPD